jgi:hypothetical protein
MTTENRTAVEVCHTPCGPAAVRSSNRNQETDNVRSYFSSTTTGGLRSLTQFRRVYASCTSHPTVAV